MGDGKDLVLPNKTGIMAFYSSKKAAEKAAEGKFKIVEFEIVCTK